MRSINVNIVGNANMSKAQAGMARLAAATAEANEELAKMMTLQNGVDADGYKNMRSAAQMHSAYFRDAVASSGMFEAQQVRLNKSTDQYIRNLDKQKLSFKKMAEQRKVAGAALQEQLAMQGMLVRENIGASSGGKTTWDIAMPKQVGRDWRAAQMKLAMLSAELKSGATQMVNWGKNTQWAGRQLMVGFTIPVAAAGAAMGVLAYGVDKELTRIAKVYDTYADRTTGRAEDIKAAEQELAELRAAGVATATKAAKEYGVSGKETLDVQAELAAVGMQGADLQKSTNEVMRIATLGEIDRTVATKAMIAMQSTLNATVEETGQLFNYMNAVENATSLATADFAEAIPRALGPMREMSAEGASAQEVFQNLSVLMVAMKERGIEAGEGANAVKALMSRLYRPSKQVSSEWVAMGLGDPRKFAEEGKDIMEILAMVNERVRGLKGNQRTQALAGLFGTYQVARMNAMLKGLDGVNQAGSQTARVFEVMSQSADQWAETADNEVAQKMSSLSGQWDAALESMKMQAQELGRPFLEMATVVVSGIVKILEVINGLPGPIKTMLGAFIGLTALAGPIIMLTGLFANLAGNAVKGVASIIGFATKLNIVTKESAIAEAAAKMVSDGFIEEATAAEQLKAEVEILAESMKRATEAHRGLAAEMAENPLRGSSAVGVATAAKGSNRANIESLKKEFKGHYVGTPLQMANDSQLDDMVMTMYGQSIVNANEKYKNAPPFIGSKDEWEATRKSADKLADAVDDAADGGEKLASSGERVRGAAKVAAGATTVMTASWALSSIFQNKYLDKIAEIAMVTSAITPLVMGIAVAWKSVTASALRAMAAEKAASVATAARGASLSNMWKSAGLRMGVYGAALVGVGMGIKALVDHFQKAREKQEKLEADAAGLGEAFRKSANIARKSWGEVVTVVESAISKTEEQRLKEKYSTGKGKEQVEVVQDLDEDQRLAALTKMYVEMQTISGLSADKAEAEITALLNASNVAFTEQQKIVNKIVASYGTIYKTDVWKNLKLQVDDFLGATPDTSKWNKAADSIAMGFKSAVEAGVENPASMQKATDNLSKALRDSYEKAYNKAVKNSTIADNMKEMGITSVDEYIQAIASASALGKDEVDELMSEMFSPGDTLKGQAKKTFESMWSRPTKEAMDAEKKILDAMESSGDPFLKMIAEGISATDDLREHWLNAVAAQPFDKAVDSIDEMMSQLAGTAMGLGPALAGQFSLAMNSASSMQDKLVSFKNVLGTMSEEDAQQVFQALRMIASANKIAFADDPVQQFLLIMRGIVPEANRAARAMRTINLTGEQMKGVYSSAMSDLSSALNDSIDSRSEAIIAGRQDMWERRQSALSNSIDKQQRGLDAKWERRNDAATKYWEKREKAVEKAIEAEQKAEELRKKMFDAEIARINRLAEMSNTNIDFNVALNEGDFDTAAKIRNDQEAQNAEYALDAAASAGSAQSEARINKLEIEKEKIGEQKDAALKALKKREDAEKRHLDRVSKMRQDALKRDQDNDMKYLKESLDANDKKLKEQLAADLAYIPRTQEGLARHIAMMQQKYGKLGVTLKDHGNDWAAHFRQRLNVHLNKAQQEVRTDNAWKEIGSASGAALLDGLGFSSRRQFLHFIKTGEMLDEKKGKGNPSGRPSTEFDPDTGRPQVRHTGGLVGSGNNNRKGVARTNPIHPSERLLLARKNEMVINEDATRKHFGLLNDINDGKNLDSPNNIGPRDAKGGRGNSASSGHGLIGWMSGLVLAAAVAGTRRAMKDGVEKNKRVREQAERAAQSSQGYYDGSFRKYSLPGVKPWVLEAANYLGNKYGVKTIGGVGQRNNISDHPRGLALDFMMTGKRGDQLANEVIRLQGPLDAKYVIWKQRIQSFDGPHKGEGWRGMENRGSATANHFDHVHVSFDDKGDTGDLPKLKVSSGGGGRGSKGSGNFWKASHAGKSWSNSHDYRNGMGSPVFAIGPGRVTTRQLPPSAGSGQHKNAYPRGYGSYGVVSDLTTDSGVRVKYAHLMPGTQVSGRVRGGQMIARSASTGNSSGPHTHFEVNGSTNAKGAFARMGIPLRKGTEYVNFDNTLANLHKGEAVLTRDISSKFREGVDNFANGGQSTYNINVNVAGTDASADEIANKVVNKIKRQEARKPQSRRNS